MTYEYHGTKPLCFGMLQYYMYYLFMYVLLFSAEWTSVLWVLSGPVSLYRELCFDIHIFVARITCHFPLSFSVLRGNCKETFIERCMYLDFTFIEPFSYNGEPLSRKSVRESCFQTKNLIELKNTCPGLYPTCPTCTHPLVYYGAARLGDEVSSVG